MLEVDRFTLKSQMSPKIPKTYILQMLVVEVSGKFPGPVCSSWHPFPSQIHPASMPVRQHAGQCQVRSCEEAPLGRDR